MRSKLVATLLVVLVALFTPSDGAAATANCEFVLGFRALYSMIPSVVGDCLEHEHHNLTNGDGLQRTAGGLMVWRKADNWTAFTDGYRTWVNGPSGLQQRLNVERFPWEPDYVPVTDNPSPTDVFAYAMWVRDRLDALGAIFYIASLHMNHLQDRPDLLDDPQWRAQTGAIFQSMREVGQQMQTYQAGPLPRSFAAMHSLVVAIGQDVVYIADECTAGFDQMNVSRLMNVVVGLEAVNTKMAQLNAEVDAHPR